MRFFEWFVRALYWLQIFAAPVVLFGLISLLVYSKTENKNVAIIFLSVGFLGGIFLAEFIRRKYGLEKFFASIYGSTAKKERPKQ
jgi:hypothetical protein